MTTIGEPSKAPETVHEPDFRKAPMRPGGPSVRSGIAWVTLATAGRFVLQLVTFPVLARLLGPGQYGLATLGSTVVAFVTLFTEFGLSPFVIRAERLRESMLRQVLLLDLVVTLAFSGVMAAASPLIASFLHAPRLTGVLLVSALACSFTVKSVPVGLLEREMRFTGIALVELAAALSGQAVSVVLAVFGYGALSIAWGLVTTTGLVVVGYWLLAGWRPRLSRPSRELPAVASFTGPLMAFNFVNYWSRNVDNILLAKFGSVVDVGYYGRAYQLMLLPVQQVATVAGRVMLPVLSRARRSRGVLASGEAAFPDRQDEVLDVWTTSCMSALFIGLPMSVGLAVGGHDLIALYLGSAWLPVGQLVGILGCAIAPQLLGRLSGALYQALDLTRRQLATGTINALIVVTLIVVGLPWGRVGVAVGVSCAFWLQLGVVMIDLRRRTGLSLRRFARDAAAPVISAGALAVAGIVLVAATANWTAGPQFVLLCSVLAVSYVLILMGSGSGRAFLRSVTGHTAAGTAVPLNPR